MKMLREGIGQNELDELYESISNFRQKAREYYQELISQVESSGEDADDLIEIFTDIIHDSMRINLQIRSTRKFVK